MNNRSSSRLSPEYVLLGFLYQSPSYGYELHLRLQKEFSNIWHASQSQTYNILKRLEGQGDIQSTRIVQERVPDRLQLQITKSGAARFETWLKQPTKPSVHAIRVEFITRQYFTQLYHPERTQEMIQKQLEVVKAGMTQLELQLANLPDQQYYNRLALELRMELLGSVVSWLNGCYQAFSVGANGKRNV